LPFMPPETVRATPELIGLIESRQNDPQFLNDLADYIIKTYGYKPVVKYYIRTGLRASQLICRNYLLRLEENNRYLEFLRNEFGVAYTLATAVLLATNANTTLTNAFAISRNFVDGAVMTYEQYRFLAVDREAARVLVETVQNKFAEHFMMLVDSASAGSTNTAGGFTFSDAIHAVSIIEYQCTREGIKALLDRSVNNTPTNINVDGKTGTIIFDSAKKAKPGTANVIDTGATPPAVDKQAPRSAPSGNVSHTTQRGAGESVPTTGQFGTDPERDILKNFLRVGNSSFDLGRAQILQQLLAVDSIQAEVKRIQGTGRAPLLPEIVDVREYAPVRKLMVEEARRRGLIQ
jgi:hypothetical protein